MLKIKFLIIFILTFLLAHTSLAIEKVRVSIPAKSLNFLDLYVGKQKGIFKEEGIEPVIIVTKADVGIAGLVAGEIDYSEAGGTVVRAAATNVPVRLFLHTVGQLTFTFFTDPKITTVKDLKGKIIGITAKASTPVFVISEILKKSNLTINDVDLIATGETRLSLAVLQTGKVHAVLLSPPYDVVAKRLGFKALLEASDVVHLTQGGMGTSVKKLQTNPSQVKRVIKSVLKSIKYIKAHSDETVSIIMKEFNMDKEDAQSAYEKMSRAYVSEGKVPESVVKQEIALLQEMIKTKEDIPVSRVLDYTLLNEVLGEMKIR